MKRQCREYIVILFIIGVLTLNYPLLSLVDRPLLLLNLPLLYFYIFFVWLLLIIIMAVIAEGHISRADERARNEASDILATDKTKR